MKLHLIDPNYVFNHKYFNILKIVGAFYVCFLLRYTTFHTDDSFLKFENQIELISSLFLFLFFILSLMNSFLYLKIGELHIDNDSIKLFKNGWTKTINLKEVSSIQVYQANEKEFVLKIDTIKIPIQLLPSELDQLKNLKTTTNISFQKSSIFNKIKNSVLNFSLRNKAFIHDVLRK